MLVLAKLNINLQHTSKNSTWHKRIHHTLSQTVSNAQRRFLVLGNQDV